MSQVPAQGPPPGVPPGPPYGQPAWGPRPSMRPEEEKAWGAAAHWSAFAGAFVALAFVGPLVVLLLKGNESAYVRRQAVESLNFQLSMLIYALVAGVLVLVLIGILLLVVVGILWAVFTLVGTIKSADGSEYRYPLTIRMVT